MAAPLAREQCLGRDAPAGELIIARCLRRRFRDATGHKETHAAKPVFPQQWLGHGSEARETIVEGEQHARGRQIAFTGDGELELLSAEGAIPVVGQECKGRLEAPGLDGVEGENWQFVTERRRLPFEDEPRVILAE